jgi:hypothetical protein
MVLLLTFFRPLAYNLVIVLDLFDFCQIDDMTEVCGDTADSEEQ